MSGNRFTKQKTVDRRLKGQASMIDVLLLVTFISILLVYSFYTSSSFTLSSKVEETAYAEASAFTLLNYKNSSYGAFNNSANLTFGNALTMYLCNSPLIAETDINSTGKYAMDRIAGERYSYIVYGFTNLTDNTIKGFGLWNTQPDVCSDSITVYSFDLRLTCKTTEYSKVIFGVWPKTKTLPRKNQC
ncbi:MAG TPA: hypothetical protein VJB06_02560 [archaeon]|nr:hypothetical protein [archaeon]